MNKISVAMIVKNESKIIENCLQSILKIWYIKDVFIMDTGSTDNTVELIKEIFKKHNWECDENLVKGLYIRRWKRDDNFAQSRNEVLKKIEDINGHDQRVLSIDADEVLESLRWIWTWRLDYMYETAFWVIHNGSWEQTTVIRLFTAKSRWEWRIHETIPLNKSVSDSQNPYFVIKYWRSPTHDDDPEFDERILKKQYDEELSSYSITSRTAFYYGRELFYNQKYDEAIVVLKSWIPNDTWISQIVESYYIIAQCYKIKWDYTNARTYCSMAIGLDPFCTKTINLMVWLCREPYKSQRSLLLQGADDRNTIFKL